MSADDLKSGSGTALPADQPKHTDYACGHVSPGDSRVRRVGSKYAIHCEEPRGHSGDHRHYGGYHWRNLGDDPLLAASAVEVAKGAESEPQSHQGEPTA